MFTFILKLTSETHPQIKTGVNKDLKLTVRRRGFVKSSYTKNNYARTTWRASQIKPKMLIQMGFEEERRWVVNLKQDFKVAKFCYDLRFLGTLL